MLRKQGRQVLTIREVGVHHLAVVALTQYKRLDAVNSAMHLQHIEFTSLDTTFTAIIEMAGMNSVAPASSDKCSRSKQSCQRCFRQGNAEGSSSYKPESDCQE